MDRMWIIVEISISKLLQTLSNRKKDRKGHAWPQRDEATETRIFQSNVVRENRKERKWMREKNALKFNQERKKAKNRKTFSGEKITNF